MSIASQTSELMPLPTITTSNVSMSASRSPHVPKRPGPCHGDRLTLVVQTRETLTALPLSLRASCIFPPAGAPLIGYPAPRDSPTCRRALLPDGSTRRCGRGP